MCPPCIIGCFQLPTCPHQNPPCPLCVPSTCPLHTLCMPSMHPMCILGCFQLPTCPHLGCMEGAQSVPSMRPLHTLHAPHMHLRMFSIAYMSPPQPSTHPMMFSIAYMSPPRMHGGCTLRVPSTQFLIGYMSPPHPIILLESRT